MKRNTWRKSLLTVTGALLIAMMVFFTGCGGPQTLEDYVNDNDEIKTEIDSYSQEGMTVEIKENVLSYVYQYADTYDESMVEDMAAQFESAMASVSSTFSNIASTLEEETEIDGITVRVTYLNGDGSEIYTQDFQSE